MSTLCNNASDIDNLRRLEQDREPRGFKMVVIREYFGKSEAAHDYERDMIDDSSRARKSPTLIPPCFFKFF